MSAESPSLFDPLPANLASAPAAAEEEVLALWSAEKTFERLQESREQSPPFVFWEGPPTANGRPGIHHVLARTLKDAVCRTQSMLGKRVERKAGWDTHGLPVELEVEKALKISGKPQIEAYGVAAFNAKCRESVWKYREEWERLSARIGYWLDYEHPYVTYAPEYVDSVWFLLASLHEKGLIYRGKRVLPFCGRCGTGLSSHELGQPGVYQDLLDPSVHVRFPLRDARGRPERESFLAWTTTPWTLPSNVGLAVHPSREYVRARVALPVPKGEAAGSRGHEIVWLAAERAVAVLGKDFEVLERKRGRELAGQRYFAPFATDTPREHGFAPAEAWDPPEVDPGAWKPDAQRAFRVAEAEYVTVEDGTGIVHQAPAYGVDDWMTAQREAFPVIAAVGNEGKLVRDVQGVRAGTFFKDADEALMEDLRTRGFLFRKSREKHSYPHCWRCSTALFYFAAPAWYIRTTAQKQRMIDANAAVNWVPAEVGTKRFGEWLANNVDWNISRDRYWGTPLPFWVCEACNHERAIHGAGELRAASGGLPADFDHHKPSIDAVVLACDRCGGTMKRTPAVLDCWFDSGAMPFAQHGWPHLAGSAEKLREQFPAHFICEGLDQTRGWFYTLHAIGTLAESIPELGLDANVVYQSCLVNGLVLDKEGVKMSKRLGNVVDPWKVIAEHGADAVRWYLIASAAPYLAKKFDPDSLADARRRFFGTLLNSYGFLREYARVDRFDPADARIPALEQRPAIDRWLVSRASSLAVEVRDAATSLDLTRAARAIETFVVDEMSNWYIRRNRRRFWKSESGADKLAAFATLHEALRNVALLSAPITPFCAELLWRRLVPGGGSVHQALLPSAEPRRIDPELESSMEIVQRLVVMGRALREKAGHRVRQPLSAIHVRSSKPHDLELLRTKFASEQILDELNVKSIGSLGADDGQLCRLTAKANFKVLGKRLGARMKAAAAAIEALSAAELGRLRAGLSVELLLEGEPISVGPEDVLIQVESQAEFDVETDGRFVVWLDTALDPELIAEGLAREAVNRINGLRKKRELAIEDRIRLELFHAGDATLGAALERHRGFIAAETLAVGIVITAASDPQEGSESFDLGDSIRLGVRLERA